MLGIHELWLFILSGLLLNVTPGPDTAYIIGRSLQLGWRGGAAAALGIGTGCLVHVSAAAIGLSALLVAAAGTGAIALRRVFWQGALTNVLNPKVALFFLAFLPQFVAADSPHQAIAFALLGLIFVFNGTLWCLGVAAFAAGAAGRIRRSGQALLWINRALGGLFVSLGVRVALLQAR